MFYLQKKLQVRRATSSQVQMSSQVTREIHETSSQVQMSSQITRENE